MRPGKRERKAAKERTDDKLRRMYVVGLSNPLSVGRFVQSDVSRVSEHMHPRLPWGFDGKLNRTRKGKLVQRGEPS